MRNSGAVAASAAAAAAAVTRSSLILALQIQMDHNGVLCQYVGMQVWKYDI